MDKLERLQTIIPDPTRSALASAVDGGRKVYMNMTKKLVLAAGLTLLGGTAAFGENARGYFNNWADDCQLKQTGNYYSGTLQAHAGGSAGLKFDRYGSTKWGGTSASAAIVNQTIGSASWFQSNDSLPMDVSDGYYYTFHLAGNYSWSNRFGAGRHDSGTDGGDYRPVQGL